ncbi:MAG: ABC transporter substrate-binding protein [Thermoanaerobaculia bacterium]
MYGRSLLLLWIAWLLFFSILLAILTPVSGGRFWAVVGVAALSTFVVIARVWYKPLGVRLGEDSVTPVLNQITAGDLTIRTDEIRAKISSKELSGSIRALLLNLERTITRFSQLVSDVTTAGDQISRRARALSMTAGEQLSSTQSTSQSLEQIDASIKSVGKSMENLSLNAEETSTSVLEMSASIQEVTRIGENLSEYVEQTASAIEEMIASINEVATNTESFSSFATETASSMIEMNTTTQEIAKSAQQSSDLARYVMDSAGEGLESVLGTVEGMRKIQGSVDESKNALMQLAERSAEIGEIVRVIDEIAGQTNLLALNAAIIAAQAGERGKGFAVVADEIRDLSERTSVSTEEIRTLISNVQRGVDRAIEQMNVSSEHVNEGVGLTSRAETVLTKIRDLIERSTQSISEIARATEEQMRGSESTTQAIEEVTKMVQQMAAATQQQSITSLKIGQQTSVVRDYMKHLQRAMEEQESGSKSIGSAMENVMSAVSMVLESTSILANESAAVVSSMAVIERGARESNFGVADLSQMANTLRHESSLLQQELQRFQLPSAAQGGRVVTATVIPQLTLDPVYAQFMALSYVQKAIHENLVLFGEGAELVPGLAERWEVLDHGTVYRFHLRPDARFHNGRSVTAKDVKETFLRLLSPQINSSGKWIMRFVSGADAVIDGKASDAAGFRVVSDRTIEIVLEEPLAFFLLLLSMPEAAIVPIEEARDAARFRTHPVGAGPFRVDEVREGEFVRLARNPSYFRPNIPHVDELEFRLDLKSAKDVANAFFAGDLDIAHGVPLPVVKEIREDPQRAPYLRDTIMLHTSYLGWDNSVAPFDRVEVRQAVSHAINRNRLNENIFSGLGMIAESLLPPGLPGYDPNRKGYQYDPERARALLRKGGFPSGFSIDYWRWDTDEFYNSGLMDLIVEDLAAIGIRVNVTLHDAKEARSAQLAPGHKRIFAANWYADFPDSDNFFFIFFHSESEVLKGLGYGSAEIDGQIERARRTNDPEERVQIYRTLDEKILQDSPISYLFHDRLFVLHKPEVRGLRTYLAPPPVRYHDVWLER